MVPQQSLRMAQERQVVLSAKDTRNIDQIARIRAAIILDELSVDHPPVESSVGDMNMLALVTA